MPNRHTHDQPLSPELDAIAQAAADRLRAQCDDDPATLAQHSQRVADAASAAIHNGAGLSAIADAERVGEDCARRELRTDVLAESSARPRKARRRHRLPPGAPPRGAPRTIPPRRNFPGETPSRSTATRSSRARRKRTTIRARSHVRPHRRDGAYRDRQADRVGRRRGQLPWLLGRDRRRHDRRRRGAGCLHVRPHRGGGAHGDRQADRVGWHPPERRRARRRHDRRGRAEREQQSRLGLHVRPHRRHGAYRDRQADRVGRRGQPGLLGRDRQRHDRRGRAAREQSGLGLHVRPHRGGCAHRDRQSDRVGRRRQIPGRLGRDRQRHDRRGLGSRRGPGGQGLRLHLHPTLPVAAPHSFGGGATGGGGGGPTGGVGAVLGFGSKTLVSLQLAARRIPATGPLKIRVGNGEPFAITGMLWAETARKVPVSRTYPIKLQAKTFSVAAHTSKTVALKLPRVLQRLLARGHTLDLRLTAKVKDPAGHTRSGDKRVTIRLEKSHRR